MSKGVARVKEAVPVIVLVTFAGTAPPYIRTLANGKAAVLVAVPVKAMPLASVMKVRLMEPVTVAVTLMVPEPVWAWAAPVTTRTDSTLVRIGLSFMPLVLRLQRSYREIFKSLRYF